MPPASLRIRPARTISLWLTSSASAGASLSVARKYREVRIAGGASQDATFYLNSHAPQPRAASPSNRRRFVKEWAWTDFCWIAYARSRRLSAERRHHPLQRAQRGFLGQARQGTLLAVSAGRDQAWGNACAGDVPRTAGRSGPAARPREDPGPDAQLAALRGARAVAQTGLARQLPGAEADLVPAPACRARV